MRIFVAGATGALGRELVPRSRSRGHTVVGLSRSDENDAALARMGAEGRRGDLFDPASLADAMQGCEVVVRAATHIPTSSRPRLAEWATNDRIRREGTRALLEAARTAGAKRYVQESVVWVARPPDGARFDEDSPVHPAPITQSALDAERLAQGAAGVDTATLRFGLFYGVAAQTQQMAGALRKRALPVMRPDDTPLAMIHVQDAASAIVAAAEGSAKGVFHVTDGNATPTGEYFDAFAEALRAPRPWRIPRWVGALAAGSYAAELLTTPMVTSNARFRKAFSWAPEHGSATEGIAQEARRLTS